MVKWLARLGLPSTLTGVLSGLLAALLLAFLAYVHGYRYAAARGEAALADYQQSVARAQAENARRHAEALQAEVARGDAASVKLQAQRGEIAKLTTQLQRRVNHVSTVYIERPGEAPQSLPERPFTLGWVRDYNAGLGLRLPEALHSASGVAATSAGVRAVAGADRIAGRDLARSSVNQADVLAVHHANAQICRDAIAQLNAILNLYAERR